MKTKTTASKAATQKSANGSKRMTLGQNQNRKIWKKTVCKSFSKKVIPSSPVSLICGEVHLEIFGTFTIDNHQVYFDLNDFDDALAAPAIRGIY